MSNLAEKLPRLVKEKLENVETRRQELVGRLDSWVDTNLPKSVVAPIRETETVTVDTIKDAAAAAGDELVSFLRTRWTVLRGGELDTGNPVDTTNEELQTKKTETVAKKPAAKKPAAKKPAAKKPAAKKPAAKKPAAKKSVAKKPAAKKPAAKKPAAKKTAAKKPAAQKPAAKKATATRKSRSTDVKKSS